MVKKKIEKSVDELLTEALIKKEDQPYQIPDNWRWVNLNTIAKWGSGGTPSRSSSEYYNGEIPWIKTGELNTDVIYNSEEKITILGLENSSAKIFPQNSVIIAMYGATIGKVSMLGIEASTNQACAVAIPYEKVNEKYLFYYLKAQRNNFIALGKGGAQPNISQTVLKKYSFPLSPLPEQKRIVTKLSSMLEKLKQAKELIQEARKTFETRRAAILHKAFTGELTKKWREENVNKDSSENEFEILQDFKKGWIENEIKNDNNEVKRLQKKLKKHRYVEIPKEEIPSTWISASLLKICALAVDCHNKTAPYENEGIPLVRTSNIKNGTIDLIDTKFVSKKTYEFWSRRCPPEPDDILFTREAPIGESAVIPPQTKLCMGQRMMLLRFFNNYSNVHFFAYALKDVAFQNRMLEKAVGTGVKHLRVGDVESLTVPIPPINEQKEIVRILDKILNKETESSHLIELKNEIDLLEKSILSKAFRGELDTNNPDNEPARKLLKRILQEKKELPKKKIQLKISKPKDTKISSKPASLKISSNEPVIAG